MKLWSLFLCHEFSPTKQHNDLLHFSFRWLVHFLLSIQGNYSWNAPHKKAQNTGQDFRTWMTIGSRHRYCTFCVLRSCKGLKVCVSILRRENEGHPFIWSSVILTDRWVSLLINIESFTFDKNTYLKHLFTLYIQHLHWLSNNNHLYRYTLYGLCTLSAFNSSAMHFFL